MEKRGIPAAVICTEPFTSSAKAMALAHGFNDYPFVIIPHPISATPQAELDLWVERVMGEIEDLLISNG